MSQNTALFLAKESLLVFQIIYYLVFKFVRQMTINHYIIHDLFLNLQ
jgi:hypothetical protein